MRLVLVGGTTRTARIDGISAAGTAPELLAHTPIADLEVVAYGRPVRAPAVPVSPTGTPTPAEVTRAVRELVDVDVLAVDAGLARRTGAPTVDVGASPGGDVREPEQSPAPRPFTTGPARSSASYRTTSWSSARPSQGAPRPRSGSCARWANWGPSPRHFPTTPSP